MYLAIEKQYKPAWSIPAHHKPARSGFRTCKRAVWLIVAFSITCVLASMFNGLNGSKAVEETSLQNGSQIVKESSSPKALTNQPKTPSPQQRRLTLVAAWNSNNVPSYLKHFLYTTQLNAAVVDLLLLNRARPGGECFDLPSAGIDVSWADNIKVVCMEFDEWTKRHVDFLCGDDGWNCSATQREEVTAEFQKHEDVRNIHWRPLQGYIFRDLFVHPESPFWAYADMDSFLGNFADFPFDVLAEVSFLTGDSILTDALFLRGQFTAWNMDDKDLKRAWKKFPSLKSSDHYTKQLEGDMAEHSDEGYWSKGYVRSYADQPGSNLSWAMIPNLLGDDTYDGEWMKKNSTQSYVISGRDILLAARDQTREDAEEMLLNERQRQAEEGPQPWQIGKLTEEVIAVDSCPDPRRWRHTCVQMPDGTQTYPPRYESTLTHLKGQEASHVSVHMKETDWEAPYQRKLIKHHLFSKKKSWFTFPPFEITSKMILRYNADFMEVFEIGTDRDVTLYEWRR